jgi:hypothetical protein
MLDLERARSRMVEVQIARCRVWDPYVPEARRFRPQHARPGALETCPFGL